MLKSTERKLPKTTAASLESAQNTQQIPLGASSGLLPKRPKFRAKVEPPSPTAPPPPSPDPPASQPSRDLLTAPIETPELPFRAENSSGLMSATRRRLSNQLVGLIDTYLGR